VTFSSSATLAGQNLDTRISATETVANSASASASTNATAITSLQGKTANQSLSGVTTTFGGILSASTIHLSGTSLATTLSGKANTSAPVFTTSFQSPSINDSATSVTVSQPLTVAANLTTPSMTDVSGIGINISTPLTVAGQFISPSINDNGGRINANSLLNARGGFEIDGTNIGSIYQTQAGMSNYQTTSGMGAYAALASANTFSNQNTMSRVCETMSGVVVTSNSCTIDFTSSLLGLYYMTPSSGTNFTCNLINVPTSNNSCTYTITLIINVSTHKARASVTSINGDGVSNFWVGGVSSVSVNASATRVVQTISIVFAGSSTPYTIQSLASAW
jgi:hypothetical protein